MARHKAGRPEGAKTRFPGVCADSKALGVNVRSLQRVLSGEWHLPGLLGRYKALKANQQKTEKAKS